MEILRHKYGIVELYEDKLIIKKRGSFWLMRSSSEKTFYFEHIRSFEKNNKRPLIDDAFIQIEIGGSGSGKGGSLSDNSIPFNNNEDMNAAYKILEASLNNYKAGQVSKEISPAISVADEIKKYKDLLDNNIISQDEFNAKKKELLGL